MKQGSRDRPLCSSRLGQTRWSRNTAPSGESNGMVDHPLSQVSPTFDRMYADNGREAIPPEHPLKACLLMALFSVSSERQFCERLEYDLLFKWFSDLNIMDRSFKHSGVLQEQSSMVG